eukprot:GILK01016006.1.p1 GENE.GILK01016006.1~~GILK01016006.1.p1  ORF type:complete len:147 (-),score=16.55 GILK01016006.1:117-530(-)
MAYMLGSWLLVVVLYNVIGAITLLYSPNALNTFFPHLPDFILSDVGQAYRRLLAVWIVTFATVRVYCAFNLQIKALYHATMATFVFWMVWLSYEVFVVEFVSAKSMTVSFAFGIISLLWMACTYGQHGDAKGPFKRQ